MRELSEQVQRVLKENNIPVEHVETMLQHAALYSHDRGNRRWQGWLFQINGDKVEHMSYLEPVVIQRKGSMKLTVMEDCPTCEAEGCQICGWVGAIQFEYS